MSIGESTNELDHYSELEFTELDHYSEVIVPNLILHMNNVTALYLYVYIMSSRFYSLL